MEFPSPPKTILHAKPLYRLATPTLKEVLTIWHRPFEMFVCEPIVLSLSLLSGFSDTLIFIFLKAYTPAYEQWGFDDVTTGLAFTP